MTEPAPTTWSPLSPGLARPETHPERRARPPIRFGPGPRRVIVAAVEVVAPERKRFAFDAAAWCVPFVESYLAYMPRGLGRLFPLGLIVFEWAALLLAGGRFSRLDRAARTRYVERLARSRILAPLHDIWIALRGLVACGFYSHPEVAAHLGYAHQPWIDQKTRERKEKFGAPEPW